MKHTITTYKGTYLIRGPWTVEQLKAQYWAFVRKYGVGAKPGQRIVDFDEWLGTRGKVYVQLKKANKGDR